MPPRLSFRTLSSKCGCPLQFLKAVMAFPTFGAPLFLPDFIFVWLLIQILLLARLAPLALSLCRLELGNVLFLNLVELFS